VGVEERDCFELLPSVAKPDSHPCEPPPGSVARFAPIIGGGTGIFRQTEEEGPRRLKEEGPGSPACGRLRHPLGGLRPAASPS
jgi:hypothetical protein